MDDVASGRLLGQADSGGESPDCCGVPGSAFGRNSDLLAVLDALPDVAFVKDSRSVYITASHKFCEGVGVAREQLAGKTDYDLFPRELAEIYRSEDRCVLAGQVPTLEVERVLVLRGASVEVLTRKVPLRDSEGRITAVIGVATDISHRRQAEQAAQAGEERYRKLVETANEGVLATDADFRVTFVNRRLAEMLGYAPGEMVGRPVGSFIPESDQEDHAARMEERRKGAASVFERRYLTKSGGTIWTRISSTPLSDEEGRFTGALALITDITAERLSEDARQQSERRFRALFENAPVGVFRSTPEGRAWEINPAGARMLGYESPAHLLENLGDRDLATAYHLDPAERREAVEYGRAHPGEWFRREVQLRHKQGETVHVEAYYRNPEGYTGGVCALEGFLVDRTALKQAERELRASEARFRTVADYAYDWEMWIAGEGEIEYVSPSCERITGYGPREFSRDPDLVERIVHPEDRELYGRHTATHDPLAQADAQHLEYRVVTRSGNVRWLHHCCCSAPGPRGEPGARRVSNRDITDRKNAEALLEAIRQMQRLALAESGNEDSCWAMLGVLAETSSSASGFLDGVRRGPDGRWCRTGLVVFGTSEAAGQAPAMEAWLNALMDEPRRIAQPLIDESRRFLAVPLYANGDLVGVAGLADRPGGYDQAHAAYLAPLLNTFARSIQALRARVCEREYVEALRLSEAKWRAYIEKSPMAVLLADDRGRYLEGNPAAREMTGYSEAELLNRTLLDMFPPEAVEPGSRHFARVRCSGRSEGVLRLRRKGGETYHCSVVAVRVAENRFLAFCQDVTAKVQAEEALELSEQRLRLALEGSSDGWWDQNVLTGEVFWSSRCFTMLGYVPGEFAITTETFALLCHPVDRPALAGDARQWVDGNALDLEVRIRSKTGEWLWLAVRGKVVERGRSGEILRISGTFTDITARKRAELALRESEDRYRTIIEDSPQFVMVVRADRYIYANPAAVRALGFKDASEIVGRPFLKTIHPSQRDAILERARAGMNVRRSAPIELCVLRADGTEMVTESVSVPIQLDGNPAVLVLGTDITARKQMDSSLRASLAEKEVLLREVHHRVKNNLAAITGLLALQRKTLGDAPSGAMLTELAGRIQSMALVHEKLYHSENLARVNFGDYLRALIAGLRTTYSVPAGVRCRVEADMEMTLDTAIPCGMIVNELVTNSMKYAFPDGAARSGQVDEISVVVGRDGATCEILVADNGVGLPPDFDWITTNTLGVRLVRMLAQHQLGGAIQVDSCAGTRFTIRFVPAGRRLEDAERDHSPGRG